MQAQHVARAQHALAFDPCGHAAPALGGPLEAPAEPRGMVVDHLRGQVAGAVLHVHDEGHAVGPLQDVHAEVRAGQGAGAVGAGGLTQLLGQLNALLGIEEMKADGDRYDAEGKEAAE